MKRYGMANVPLPMPSTCHQFLSDTPGRSCNTQHNCPSSAPLSHPPNNLSGRRRRKKKKNKACHNKTKCALVKSLIVQAISYNYQKKRNLNELSILYFKVIQKKIYSFPILLVVKLWQHKKYFFLECTVEICIHIFHLTEYFIL
jgi:hypothetical protein